MKTLLITIPVLLSGCGLNYYPQPNGHVISKDSERKRYPDKFTTPIRDDNAPF